MKRWTDAVTDWLRGPAPDALVLAVALPALLAGLAVLIHFALGGW